MKIGALSYLVLWAAVFGPSFAAGQTGAYFYSTIAGLAGTLGSADGTNDDARFDFPGNLAVDAVGHIYVSDISNHTIRRISPDGTNWVVTTIAGRAGIPGSSDGTNGDALFDRPNGIAVDRAGKLFVADHYNHTIRQLTPDGTNWIVTTIAGLAGLHGNADGTNADARFWSPTGIAVDTNDHLYVTDTANFTVREIVPAGTNWIVSTIAGFPLNYGFADGTNDDAQFDYPYGITLDNGGRVYVVDWGNDAIRQVVAVGTNWVVRTIAGSTGAMGSHDGFGSVATFNFPNGICADQAGNLFVADQSNDTIRKIVGSGGDWIVTTVGGLALQAGTTDGVGSAARFNDPWAVALDGAGALYVTDYGNHTIRQGLFLPALRVSLVANKIVLSWPSAPAGYAPETSSALGAVAAWAPITSVPVTNGPNLVVVEEPKAAAAFYRLRKPSGPPIP